LPTRSCIACRRRESWEDLLHLVLIGDRVTPDPDHRLPGRGAWLHRNCFEMAKNRRAFIRAFAGTGMDQGLVLDDVESYLLNS
jgi:uncharacterized protein